MKRIVCFCLIFVILTACNNDDDQGYAYGETTSINDFVWKGLNSWYYWKEDVPYLQDEVLLNSQQYNSLIGSSSPENLFYNLLNDYPNVDKYSWIVEDVDALIANFSGIQRSNGMDFSLALWDPDMGTVLGLVNYVVPNSYAEHQGVRRGDIFYGINGQQLTTSNYRNLLDNSITVTFADNVVVDNNEVILEGSYDKTLIKQELEENPVHYYAYYTEGDRVVAYLVYNAYRANYNDELNEVFSEFVANGVTDLILDLRYNSGGSLSSAIGLSQMITGQFTDNPFTILRYNQNHAELDETILFTNELNLYDYQNGSMIYTNTIVPANLNLNKLYVLTTNNTASASELTISCLEPYIEVVKIGSTTQGKFVGSITLYDDASSDFTSYSNRNPSHNYAMQPIVFSYSNANQQMYAQGIMSDYEVRFGDYLGVLGAFGDVSDPALSQALRLINGDANRRAQTAPYLDEFDSFKTMQKFGSELYRDQGITKNP